MTKPDVEATWLHEKISAIKRASPPLPPLTTSFLHHAALFSTPLLFLAPDLSSLTTAFLHHQAWEKGRW